MKKSVLLVVFCLLTTTVQAKLYQWVDDQGNTHFSDKVPASASTNGHSVLNKAGAVKAIFDPKLIQAKKEAITQNKLEKAKKEEIRRIKREALAVVQKRDDYLNFTYENEQELVKFFETKIKMLNGNAKILEAQSAVLNKKVTRLKHKKSTTTQEKALKAIEYKIININLTIDQYKQALIDNQQQVSKLNYDYDTDLTRYIELAK